MTGPKNFRDVASGDLGDALLQAARSETHSDSAVERTLIALSLAASVTALGGASVAKAAVDASVTGASLSGSGAVGTGVAGAGLSSVVAPGAASVTSAVTKSALLLTMGKWFGATAIASGAALGGMQLWQRSQVDTSSSLAANTAVLDTSGASGSNGAGVDRAALRAAQPKLHMPEAVDDTATQDPARAALAVPNGRVNSVREDTARVAAVGADPAALVGSSAGESRDRALDAPLKRAQTSEPSGVASVASGREVPTAQLPPEALLGGTPSAQVASSPPGVYSEPVVPAPASPLETKAETQRQRRGVTLALEVRSIDAVRERLRAGDAGQALDLLVKHRAQFGSGALGPEALFLQMEAERALGRRAAAVRTARQILERFPKGPSAESARQLLGE